MIPSSRTTDPNSGSVVFCSVDGCDKPVKRADLCYGHYMKTWRYGTPTPKRAPRWRDLTGQRFGKLVAERRLTDDRAGRWECRCDCGELVLIRVGDLRRGTARSCGVHPCREPSTARLDDAGYSAAHGRVERDRGRPSEYPCTDCGASAQEWSYDHEDPDERVSDERGSKGSPFSLDPSHYDPRCVPCHRRFDSRRRAGSS